MLIVMEAGARPEQVEAVVRGYGVGAFPTNYFVAPDGTISSSSVGLTTRFALWARMRYAK